MDTLGLETVKTAKSALKCAEMVHSWLGAKFEQKEIQLTTPNVPGITYNLEKIVFGARMIAATSTLRRSIRS